MDSSSLGMTIAIILLICMSAYFSATETAFSSMNRIRLKTRADDGDKRAAMVLAMSEDYDRLLSTILIGNNIVNITATTLAAVLFTKLVGQEYGPTVSTIVLTVAVLVFGEVTPKSIAKEQPEKFAMAAAPLLRVLLVVLLPLNFLFSLWKKLLNRIFHTKDDQGITEEELITMVEEAEEEGGLDEHESELIRSAIEFGDLEVGDILTPRVDVYAVPRTATMEEVAAAFTESGYSRLPVYQESIDDIVGVIHEKDFYAARFRGQTSLEGFIGTVHFTTLTTPLDELLRTLQLEKGHMAVVVDEYGGTEGIVTMEDIIEEIIGEIDDEYDDDEKTYQRLNQFTYLFQAKTLLTDFYRIMNLDDEFFTEVEGDADTLAGLLLEIKGEFPSLHERITYRNLTFEVMEMDERRIVSIKVIQGKEHKATK